MKKSLLTLLLLVPISAHAAELVTFQEGTTAKASEVNSNFEALNEEIQANKGAIENISLTPGPAGAAGPQGATGAQGPAGPQGATGPQGPQGDVGPQGGQGVAGVQGPQGDTGPAGPQGVAGAQGPQGETGPQGNIGPQGVAGAQGPQGDIGPAGPQGVAGVQGPQGDIGPQGSQGPAGVGGVPAAVTVGVDCTQGDSIQDVIDLEPAGILTINVIGTCNESISIARSNVIIDGGGTAIISPPGSPGVHILGATNIEINNITINGGANTAVHAIGSQIELSATHISSTGHEFFAVVLDNSRVFMTGSSFNHTDPSGTEGTLLAFNNSAVTLNGGNLIATNGFEADAVALVHGSRMMKWIDAQESDTITSTNGLGMIMEGNASLFAIGESGLTINGDLELLGGSYMLVEAFVLNGRLEVTLNSSVLGEGFCDPACDNLVLNGDIRLTLGGMLDLRDATVTTNNMEIHRLSDLDARRVDFNGYLIAFGVANFSDSFFDGIIHCPFGGALPPSSPSGVHFFGTDISLLSITGINQVLGQPSCAHEHPGGTIPFPAP